MYEKKTGINLKKFQSINFKGLKGWDSSSTFMNRIKQALFTFLFFQAQYTTPLGRLNISDIVKIQPLFDAKFRNTGSPLLQRISLAKNGSNEGIWPK